MELSCDSSFRKWASYLIRDPYSRLTTDLSLKRILKSRIPLIFTPLTGKNESPPTDFTHLRAGPKIMSAMWGLNRVAESFLRLKWGKEFIITN
jgi:hypothetical protein